MFEETDPPFAPTGALLVFNHSSVHPTIHCMCGIGLGQHVGSLRPMWTLAAVGIPTQKIIRNGAL